jgi:hypothetical protein
MTSKGESTKLDVIDERLLTRSSRTERADDDLLDPVYREQVRRWREEQRLQVMDQWYAHHRHLSSVFRRRAAEHDAKAEALKDRNQGLKDSNPSEVLDG